MITILYSNPQLKEQLGKAIISICNYVCSLSLLLSYTVINSCVWYWQSYCTLSRLLKGFVYLMVGLGIKLYSLSPPYILPYFLLLFISFMAFLILFLFSFLLSSRTPVCLKGNITKSLDHL